jgi:hypothetical protein
MTLWTMSGSSSTTSKQCLAEVVFIRSEKYTEPTKQAIDWQSDFFF